MTTDVTSADELQPAVQQEHPRVCLDRCLTNSGQRCVTQPVRQTHKYRCSHVHRNVLYNIQNVSTNIDSRLNLIIIAQPGLYNKTMLTKGKLYK